MVEELPPVESSGWVAVRCVFRFRRDPPIYEERITLWRSPTMDEAMARAEAEAKEYAAILDCTLVDFAQAYLLSDDVADGAEVFSLMRDSSLDPDAYVDRFFDTGDERQQRSGAPAEPPGSVKPVPFEVHESGAWLHGTKADLRPGDVLVPGHASNFERGRIANHVYVTATLDAATWGAELALGEGRGRIYVVEPTGALEDDPNVTDKKFPGNPTRSFRTQEPVRIVGELTDWVGHDPATLQARRDRVAELLRDGTADIHD